MFLRAPNGSGPEQYVLPCGLRPSRIRLYAEIRSASVGRLQNMRSRRGKLTATRWEGEKGIVDQILAIRAQLRGEGSAVEGTDSDLEQARIVEPMHDVVGGQLFVKSFARHVKYVRIGFGTGPRGRENALILGR